MQRSCVLIALALLAPALGHQLWATKQFLSEAASGMDSKLSNEDNMIIKMPDWIPSSMAKASLAEAKTEGKGSMAISASAELEHMSREARGDWLKNLLGKGDDEELAKKPLQAPGGDAQALRPVVQAKVKKIMRFMETNNDAYEKADSEGRKKLEQQVQDQITAQQSAVGFDYALCLQLWNTPKVWASKQSFWNCPSLIFPDKDLQGTPDYETVLSWKPSPLKSAWLSQYMVMSVVGEKTGAEGGDTPLCSQIAEDATLWTGNTYTGKTKVCIKLTDQGWPTKTEVKGPEYWKCNKDSCTVPVKAWAEQTCTVYCKFNSAGKMEEMHLPLPCWR